MKDRVFIKVTVFPPTGPVCVCGGGGGELDGILTYPSLDLHRATVVTEIKSVCTFEELICFFC